LTDERGPDVRVRGSVQRVRALPRPAQAGVAAAVAIAVWALCELVLPRGLPLGIVLFGSVYGALYALIAVGVVLVYRANRVVNFAQAELGSVAAVIAIHLGAQRGWNYFLSVAIGLALGAVIGAGVDAAVIRRFREAPRLVLSVATIAVSQVLTGISILLAVVLSKGLASGDFTTPFSVSFGVEPVTFHGDHVVAIVVALVVLGSLAAFLRKNDYGIAIRAAADSRDRAYLVGIPVARLSTIVWSLAGMLSAAAVIFRVPISGFVSFTSISEGGPALLVRTLAAAVIARMESLPVTVAAAIGIGVFEAAATWNTGSASVVDALLVLVILLALLAQRSRVSRKDETVLATTRWRAIREVRPVPDELRRLPEVRFGRTAIIAALIAFAVTLPLWASASRTELATVILIYSIVAVSLVVLTGWAGQVSLGQWALVGFGGTAAAVMYQRHGWDLFLALPVGVIVAALVALLVGLPALRIRGPFLAVTTLAFALTASTYFFNPNRFGWFIATFVDRPALWGRVALDNRTHLYYVALAALVGVILAVAALRRTRTGRALIAIRENEPAAESVAIPSTRLKLTAFVISGAIAGLAGVLYVMYASGLRVDAFDPDVSLRVFSMVVIGGLGSILGAVLGAVYIRGAEFFLPAGWTLIASGAGILVLLLVLPGGLGELVFRFRDRLLRRIADRRGLVVPSLVADVASASVVPRAATVPATGPVLLDVRGLDVAYDQVQVLFGVDFSVAPGEIVALLGTNGAGKSTLLRAISGLRVPSSGTITFDGDDITGADPVGITRRGISHVPGGRGVFASLTVAENLRMAGWLYRDDDEYLHTATEGVLGYFPSLRERWNTAAGDLSGGEQQMLSLGQAFIARPKLLLIDELSLGLAPAVLAQLLGIVRAIHESGTAVVLVEQSVNTALELAERAVFMEKGEVRFSGETSDLLDRSDILRAVFLTAQNGKRTPRRTRSGEVVLETEGLSKTYGAVAAVTNVALTARAGEIVGIIGPNGAGKTTLFDLISGLQTSDGGRVVLDGADVTDWPAHMRSRHGLGRSFQDARLWPALTVREALAVAMERRVEVPAALPALFGLPIVAESEAQIWTDVAELIELMRLEAYRDKFVSELSTGTRRIVEIGTVLAHRPRVVLLDEPSSGIAQKEAEALGPMLRDVRDRTGCSMVVIEHDMRLITSLADRLIALDLGSVIAEGKPRDVIRDERVVSSYMGSTKTTRRRRPSARTSGRRPRARA
jgi:ABC-type branched-subunit amino acid transport system ATPase component/ABC-type branched-subunit amino acid transport system permease subunit